MQHVTNEQLTYSYYYEQRADDHEAGFRQAKPLGHARV